MAPVGGGGAGAGAGSGGPGDAEARAQAARQLFFAKVAPHSTPEQVRSLFERFGTVSDVNLFRAWATARSSKGCGLVTFERAEDAAAARAALNGIHVWPGGETPMVCEWCDPGKVTAKGPAAAAGMAADRVRGGAPRRAPARGAASFSFASPVGEFALYGGQRAAPQRSASFSLAHSRAQPAPELPPHARLAAGGTPLSHLGGSGRWALPQPAGVGHALHAGLVPQAGRVTAMAVPAMLYPSCASQGPVPPYNPAALAATLQAAGGGIGGGISAAPAGGGAQAPYAPFLGSPSGGAQALGSPAVTGLHLMPSGASLSGSCTSPGVAAGGLASGSHLGIAGGARHASLLGTVPDMAGALRLGSYASADGGAAAPGFASVDSLGAGRVASVMSSDCGGAGAAALRFASNPSVESHFLGTHCSDGGAPGAAGLAGGYFAYSDAGGAAPGAGVASAGPQACFYLSSSGAPHALVSDSGQQLLGLPDGAFSSVQVLADVPGSAAMHLHSGAPAMGCAALLGAYGQLQAGWQGAPASQAGMTPPAAVYAAHPLLPCGGNGGGGGGGGASVEAAAAPAGAPPGLSVPLTSAQAAALGAQLPALSAITGCDVRVRQLASGGAGALHELVASGPPQQLAGASLALARILALTQP